MSDPDQVSLDPEHAAVLANVAQQTGKSYQELVADAIDLAFVHQRQSNLQELSWQQRQNLFALLKTTSQLPVCQPQDGLSGRDHDQILYGSN